MQCGARRQNHPTPRSAGQLLVSRVVFLLFRLRFQLLPCGGCQRSADGEAHTNSDSDVAHCNSDPSTDRKTDPDEPCRLPLLVHDLPRDDVSRRQLLIEQAEDAVPPNVALQGRPLAGVPCRRWLGVTCALALPCDTTQRRTRTHNDHGWIRGACPSDASAVARESSISASCMGR